MTHQHFTQKTLFFFDFVNGDGARVYIWKGQSCSLDPADRLKFLDVHAFNQKP